MKFYNLAANDLVATSCLLGRNRNMSCTISPKELHDAKQNLDFSAAHGKKCYALGAKHKSFDIKEDESLTKDNASVDNSSAECLMECRYSCHRYYYIWPSISLRVGSNYFASVGFKLFPVEMFK